MHPILWMPLRLVLPCIQSAHFVQLIDAPLCTATWEVHLLFMTHLAGLVSNVQGMSDPPQACTGYTRSATSTASRTVAQQPFRMVKYLTHLAINVCARTCPGQPQLHASFDASARLGQGCLTQSEAWQTESSLCVYTGWYVRHGHYKTIHTKPQPCLRNCNDLKPENQLLKRLEHHVIEITNLSAAP